MKSLHVRKSCLAQFGEFSVAAELNRRGFLASVTYGNQKSTDIVALSDDGRYAIVEVKTTDKQRFPTGLTKQKLQQTYDNRFWVFVAAKADGELHDTVYFVLTDAEAKRLQSEENSQYNNKYRARHGIDYEKEGVPSISVSQLAEYKGAWYKISAFLESRPTNQPLLQHNALDRT